MADRSQWSVLAAGAGRRRTPPQLCPFATPSRSGALLARKHGSRLLRQIPEHGTAQGQVPAPEHKDQGAQAKPASV